MERRIVESMSSVNASLLEVYTARGRFGDYRGRVVARSVVLVAGQVLASELPGLPL